MRKRFYIEAALAAATFVLTVVTLINQEWIEAVFGVDPDHGNGSLEWIMVAVLAVATVVFGLLAFSERRRASLA
jgi:Co/Zn/Cd efflux system component